MATFFFCLFLLCTQMHFLQRASATSQARDTSQFTLAGGLQSHLFSSCISASRTFEGSLYSISASDGEEYVRFVPDQSREMAWTELELGESSNILDCAAAAFERDALMFQYDDNCSVTLDDAYNPSMKQKCDVTEGDIVFITNKALNFFGDNLVVGDTFGCVSKTDDGWVYGVEDGRLVDEDTLPPRDTCCTSAAADYCLMAECSDKPMSYCEAEARCLARGLRAASRSFHESIDSVDPTQLGTDEYYFWVNVYQEQDGVWKWQDDESNLTDFVWCGSSPPEPPPKNCAAIHFTDKPHKIEYYRTECNGTDVKCVLCNDPTDSLGSC